MLRITTITRRKPKTNQVKKYLEGIPKNETLLDHLSGADYRHSPSLSFQPPAAASPYKEDNNNNNNEKTAYYYSTRIRYLNFNLRGNLYHYQGPSTNYNVADKMGFSKLFFHHIVYPTSASRPLQVVVVRGARRTGTVLYTSSDDPHRKEKEKGTPIASSVVDPLKVPDAYLFCSSSLSSTPSSLRWVFRPSGKHAAVFASSSSSTGNKSVDNGYRYTMNTPQYSVYRTPLSSRERSFAEEEEGGEGNKNRTTSSSSFPIPRDHHSNNNNNNNNQNSVSLPPSKEGFTDSAFAPLRDALENIYSTQLTSLLQSSNNNNNNNTITVPLVKGPIGGLSTFVTTTAKQERLIPLLEYDRTEMKNRDAVSNDVENNNSTVWMKRIIEYATAIQDKRQSHNNNNNKNRSPLKFYFELTLPDDFFSSPNGAKNGMLFPYVHFALGVPFPMRSATAAGTAKNNNSNNNSNDIPFEVSHLTALVQLEIAKRGETDDDDDDASLENQNKKDTVNNITNNDNNEEESDMEYVSATAPLSSPSYRYPLEHSSSSSSSSSSSEPWKLGISLDPVAPIVTRTVGELHAFAPSPETNSNNKENRESSSSFSAPIVHGSEKREIYLLPQRELLITVYSPYYTLQALTKRLNERRTEKMIRMGHAAAGSPSKEKAEESEKRRDTDNNNNYNNSSAAADHTIPPREVLEVRALPGDVIYIPKGFGFQIQRVRKNVFLDALSPQAKGKGEPMRAVSVHEIERGASYPTPHHHHHHPINKEEVAVSVDAFLLHYHAYPELDEKQTQGYISGDYNTIERVNRFYEENQKRGFDPFRMRYC